MLSVKWTTPLGSIQRKKSAACERGARKRKRSGSSSVAIEILTV
jgi:hypothetical protein